MKIALNSLVILFMFWGCATKKNVSSTRLVGGPETVPEWVYAPNEVCNENLELCASSEGTTLEGADLNAKKSLASIFEINIKSHFQIYTTGYSQEKRSELTEKVVSDVQESLNLVLQGVEVIKRYQDQNVFYSLVKLDKQKAKKTLSLQIDDIDGQMDHLFRQNSKLNITKLLILLDKRQMLNERLIIVAGKGIPTSYTYSKIADLRFIEGPAKVGMHYTDSFPEALKKWFEGVLGNSGYKVVEDKANYEVYLKFYAKPEYLNVSGFKRFAFIIEANAKDNTSNQLGSFTVSLVSSGRNQQDAYLKIKPDLEKQIKDKMNNLNMK